MTLTFVLQDDGRTLYEFKKPYTLAVPELGEPVTFDDGHNEDELSPGNVLFVVERSWQIRDNEIHVVCYMGLKSIYKHRLATN